MNDIAQYMQETGVMSKDFDELDKYERYLYYRETYKPDSEVLSQFEWERLSGAYKNTLIEIRSKRRQVSTITWMDVNGVWGEILELEAQAILLEHQLGVVA